MKIRKLMFETEQDRENFPMLYIGFLTGGNSAAAKGMEVTRREVRILDKLDAISTEEPNGDRKLNDGPQQLLLEQPEYELLKKYFENTPWTTKVSRKVIAISDWLSGIPQEETGG